MYGHIISLYTTNKLAHLPHIIYSEQAHHQAHIITNSSVVVLLLLIHHTHNKYTHKTHIYLHKSCYLLIVELV